MVDIWSMLRGTVNVQVETSNRGGNLDQRCGSLGAWPECADTWDVLLGDIPPV